jgi:hypothetical protein
VNNDKKLQGIQNTLAEKGQYEPLVLDVFPSVPPDRSDAPFKFKDEYRAKQREFIRILNAGGAPTSLDIDLEEERIANKRLEAEKQNLLGANAGKKKPGQALPPKNPGGGLGAGQGYSKEALPLEERLESDAELRVSLSRARDIFCYATTELSLDKTWDCTNVANPSVEQMWFAQMSLWVQEDIIKALAGLNNKVAEEVRVRKDVPWVGNLPVKHLMSFHVGDYVPQPQGGGTGATSGGGGFSMSRTPGQGGGPPPGSAEEVFTSRGSQGNVDVIQLAVELVVEARKLPAVLGAICSAGFYTPLRVTYTAVPPERDWVGYVYGSDPVLQVRIEIEGCFFRSKYEALMPETVKTAIQQGTSVLSGNTGGGGGGGRRPMPGPGMGGGSRLGGS